MSKLRSKKNSLKSHYFPRLLMHDLFDIYTPKLNQKWIANQSDYVYYVFVFGQGGAGRK